MSKGGGQQQKQQGGVQQRQQQPPAPKFNPVLTAIQYLKSLFSEEWEDWCAEYPEAAKIISEFKAEQVVDALRIGKTSAVNKTIELLEEVRPTIGEDAAQALLKLLCDYVKKLTEKKPGEPAEEEKKGSQQKPVKIKKPEIHTIGEFLSSRIDSGFRALAQQRLTAFALSLSPEQRKNFAEGLKEGDQEAKFNLLATIDTDDDRKAMAEINGWI